MKSAFIPRKIVLVTHGFYPEISPRSYRATELAKELASRGHDLTVVTIDRGPETIRLCDEFGIHYCAIRQLWFKTVPPVSWLPKIVTRAINRLLLMLFEYPDIELMFGFASVLRKVGSTDLLISFAVPYPVHWGVAMIWQRSLAKCWVADCGDPYMGDESDSFRKLFYFKIVEKWFFRKPDFVAIPIEEARGAYYKEFHHKLVVIPQGVNVEHFLRCRRPYQPLNEVTFAYAGSFIPMKRDPRRLLDFLLESDLNYQFLLFTSTIGLVKDYETKSKGRIIIRKLVSREELIGILSTMDFLVNVENTSRSQAPSKLIDYYLAGRPVLSVTSDQSDFNMVSSFLKRDYNGRMDLSAFDQYNISRVGDQFLDLLTVMESKS